MIGLPGQDFPIQPGAILGFDPGKHKTGIAVGNTRIATATPLETWRIAADTWSSVVFAAHIQTLLKEWKPVVFVVGVAMTADGTPSAQQRRSQHFAERLEELVDIPTCLIDERLSSQMAGERLRALPKKSQSVGLDAIAAALIIETYISEYAAIARPH